MKTIWHNYVIYKYEEQVLKLEKWCIASSFFDKCWEDKIIDKLPTAPNRNDAVWKLLRFFSSLRLIAN